MFATVVDIYRAKGWTPFPLMARTKAPPPPGVTGVDGHDPDPADFMRWKVEFPDGNTGVRFGEGEVGLDVDQYLKKRGYDSLLQFQADHDLSPLPPTITSTSRGEGNPSGIRHYTFSPMLMRGRKFVSEACTNVELIHRGHRYACVWPSIHPDTGEIYRWRSPGGVLLPEGEVPHVSEKAQLPIDWVMAISVPTGSSGTRSSSTTATTTGAPAAKVPTKAEAQAWLSDQHGDGMPYEGLYRSVVDRMLAKVPEGTRYAAMRWGTSMLVGDISKGALPGICAFDLEAECRDMYEVPPAGRSAKPFAPIKERDFWNLVAGAIALYSEEGNWHERIEDDVETRNLIGDIMASGALRMDDTSIDPIEPPVPAVPAVPSDRINIDPIEDDEDETIVEVVPGVPVPMTGPSVVAGATALTRAAASMPPDEQRVFIEIVQEDIERRIRNEGRASIAQAEFTGAGLERVVDPTLQRVKREELEAWGREARARIRSRDSISNSYVPTIWPHWIEDDWLPKGSLATVIAKSSVGKTLFLVDMACRLALGAEWNGHWVEQTPVLYLSFESPHSVYSRVAAWSQYEDHQPLFAAADEGLKRFDGMLVSPKQVFVSDMLGINMRTEGGVTEIMRHLVRIYDQLGEMPGVVIIDTLAQAFGGGEENDAGEMGEFIIRMQEVLRANPLTANVTILVAHHPVKSTEHGQHATGRGSGALNAAVDVEISLVKVMDQSGDEPVDTGFIEARRLKARDGEADVKLQGVKRVVEMIGVDGLPLVNPRSGVRKSTVVWGIPTEDDKFEAGAGALSRRAELEEIARAALDVAMAEVLRRLDYFDEGKPPKLTAKAVTDEYKRGQMPVADMALVRDIATEMVKEKTIAMSEKWANEQADNGGVDG